MGTARRLQGACPLRGCGGACTRNGRAWGRYSMTSTRRRHCASSLRAFIASAFERAGMPVSDAAAVAELMVSADLGGAEGHGVFRLPQYVRRIRAGGINLHPDIRVLREQD